MSLHDSLYEWSRWIWPLALNHLWQSTVFFGLAFVGVRLLGRGPARTRYAIWLATSLKFALPAAVLIFVAGQMGLDVDKSPLWTATSAKIVNRMYRIADPVPYAASPTVPCPLDPALTCPFYNERPWPEQDTASLTQAGAATATENHAGRHIGKDSRLQIVARAGGEVGASNESAPGHSELYCWLTLIWAAGFLFCLGRWFQRRVVFARRLRAGRVMTSGREVEALRRVQLKFGAIRVRSLVLLPGTTEPGVWRTWAPVVTLPEDLASHLTDQELEAVLIHELVHVSRRDNLVGNVQMVLCCILWFCPFVWLVDRSLLNERERTCDEKVIEMGTACNVYAASLLKVLRFCSGWKMAGVSAATGSSIRGRVSAIVSKKGERQPPVRRRLTLGGITIGVVLFSLATGALGESLVATELANGNPENWGPAVTIPAAPVPDAFTSAVSEACSIRESSADAGDEQQEQSVFPDACLDSVKCDPKGRQPVGVAQRATARHRGRIQVMPGPVAK